jgi:hypothetical protein
MDSDTHRFNSKKKKKKKIVAISASPFSSCEIFPRFAEDKRFSPYHCLNDNRTSLNLPCEFLWPANRRLSRNHDQRIKFGSLTCRRRWWIPREFVMSRYRVKPAQEELKAHWQGKSKGPF